MHNLPDLWTQLYAARYLQSIAKIPRPTIAHLHAIGWVLGETHERKGICLPSDIQAVALVDWSEAE